MERHRLFIALACYLVIAVAAGLTLDGMLRLAVWLFLAVLAVKSCILAASRE